MERRQATGQFNLAQLLRIPFQVLITELHTELAARGYPDIPATHTIIFALVDKEGIGMGELAKRAQLTKQLVTYLVSAVEEHGYVERVPDPSDGRAKIVRLTERGQQAAQVGSDIIQGIEQEWAASLGPEDMDELRYLLERLVGILSKAASQNRRHEEMHRETPS